MPLRSKSQVFDEFKRGDLHSGKGGPAVTDRKQAIAIALDVERRKKHSAASQGRALQGGK